MYRPMSTSSDLVVGQTIQTSRVSGVVTGFRLVCGVEYVLVQQAGGQILSFPSADFLV